jgi:flavodoxin I
MKALVMYDSKYGNTEQIARTVAGTLERRFSVRCIKANQAAAADVRGTDLLLVGGPTHRHRMSRQLDLLLGSFPRQSLRNVRTAAFDTRYRMPAWLTGSAAGEIARRLRKLGGMPVAPLQSFFVTRDVPAEGSKRRHDTERMEAGELERAARWAMEITHSSDPD